MDSGDSVMSVANELAQRTRSTKLYGGDIIQVIHVFQNLVSKMGLSVGDIIEEKRHQLIKDLIQVNITLCVLNIKLYINSYSNFTKSFILLLSNTRIYSQIYSRIYFRIYP